MAVLPAEIHSSWAACYTVYSSTSLLAGNAPSYRLLYLFTYLFSRQNPSSPHLDLLTRAGKNLGFQKKFLAF